MKSKIEEFYPLYRKVTRFLLQNLNGIHDDKRKKEFINNFMLQMLVLWFIQKKEFFNEDKNYFITKFREFDTKKPLQGKNNYFDFLTYFLDQINLHLNDGCFEDEIIGKIVIPRPAILLKMDNEVKKISIPNKCFYKEEKTDQSSNQSSKLETENLPLFNLFESKVKRFNGFFLGELYENLIAQVDKKASGAYYTPEAITFFLCKSTIETYLLEKVNIQFNTKFETIDSLIKSHDLSVIKYLILQLQRIKVLDPAVGTAHFLESVIKTFVEIYEKIWWIAKKIGLRTGMNVITIDTNGTLKYVNLLEITEEDEFKLLVILYHILSRNVYGVDINPVVLKIAKVRLFLFLIDYCNIQTHYFKKLPEIYFNLKEGNSLIGYLQLEKGKTAKQLRLEAYLEKYSVENSELIKVDSRLREYIKNTAIALNVGECLVDELEDLNEIFNQKEISLTSTHMILQTKEKLLQILFASLDTQFAKPLQNLLKRMTDLLNVKLDENFSKEFNIDLSQLKEVKTLHWICEFPHIFLEQGGFDIIIANPPYLGESGNKELFRIYARALEEYYEGKMDLWYFFLQRSLDLMVTGAYSSFITSSYWITATGATKLRARLLSDAFIIQYISFGENKIFGTAQGVHTNIITFKNEKKSNNNIDCILFEAIYPQGTDLVQKLALQHTFKADQKRLTLKKWDQYFHFLPRNLKAIIDYITKDSSTLKTSGFYVKEGIVTGLNNITKRLIKKYKLPEEWAGLGVFILDRKNPQDLNVIQSLSKDEKIHLKNFYKNSDISRFHTAIQTTKNILYLNRHIINLDKLPRIRIHIQKFKEILKQSLDNPPYINRPRNQDIFTSPKIITPQRSVRNIFAYNSFDWYAAQDVYYILNENNDKEKLKRLLLILNSKLAYFWLYWMGKRKGKHLELFGEPLGFFPIAHEFDNYLIISRITEYLLFLHSLKCKEKDFQYIKDFFEKEIGDSLVYELYFKEKIRRNSVFQSKKYPLLELLSKKLKQIKFDKWNKLHYKEQVEKGLNDKEKLQKSTLENESLEIIEECYTLLKKSRSVSKIITQIKSNKLVKTIEEEL
ncbi:MAG: Eco57I restriction-modification methylase domain-containing protein [Promethearchaeota archaeon]